MKGEILSGGAGSSRLSAGETRSRLQKAEEAKAITTVLEIKGLIEPEDADAARLGIAAAQESLRQNLD